MSGRGALESVAHVVVAVLEDACKIRMPRTRQRHGLRALPGGVPFGRPGAHPPRPVLVVDVPDDQGERRAERSPVPEPCQHLDAVLLDLLAGRAAVALLATLQIGVDRCAIELEPGGQSRQDRHEGGPM